MSTLRLVSVEIAANADNPEVDRADAGTDILVTLPDGTELREEDGLIDGHCDQVDRCSGAGGPRHRPGGFTESAIRDEATVTRPVGRPEMGARERGRRPAGPGA